MGPWTQKMHGRWNGGHRLMTVHAVGETEHVAWVNDICRRDLTCKHVWLMD